MASFSDIYYENEKDKELATAIQVYANYLGIEIDSQRSLLHIAEEAFYELPNDWSFGIGEGEHTGIPYFYNISSGKSQWNHPNEYIYLKRVQREQEKLLLSRQTPSKSRSDKHFDSQNKSGKKIAEKDICASSNKEKQSRYNNEVQLLKEEVSFLASKLSTLTSTSISDLSSANEEIKQLQQQLDAQKKENITLNEKLYQNLICIKDLQNELESEQKIKIQTNEKLLQHVHLIEELNVEIDVLKKGKEMKNVLTPNNKKHRVTASEDFKNKIQIYSSPYCAANYNLEEAENI